MVFSGLVCVPLDSQLTPPEIKNLISDCSGRILFCSSEIMNKKIDQEIENALQKIVVIDSLRFCEKIPPQGIPLPELDSEDIASLIYTSGTTDIPKGVLLTHANLCSNFLSLKELNLFSSSDNFLSLLPLHHIFPFMANALVPLLDGATITFPASGFKPAELAKIIKEAKVTILIGVPQLFNLLHNAIYEKIKHIPGIIRFLLAPFFKKKIKDSFGKQLRFLVSGGARLEPKIAKNLTNFGFTILEGYGLTETSPVATLNLPGKVKFGSVGLPIPDVSIKINNPDKKGVGEILINGPNVMRGYFKRPDLTAQAIKDNWFYSGDLGYIDKQGYIFITGRAKDVIVLSSAKNIYPEELEKHYSSPYIKEICIFPIKQGGFTGPTISLFAMVVPDFDYFKQKNEVNIKEKIRWVLENLSSELPSYKRIMGFILSKNELPKTALRKVQRYKVKELYEQVTRKPVIEVEKTTKEDELILKNPLTVKIISYISKKLKRPVSLNSHLEIDLGVDSLSRVELGLGLEKLLSVKIPDEMLYSVSTVKEVIIKLLELIGGGRSKEFKAIKMDWSLILKELPADEIQREIRLNVRFSDWLFLLSVRPVLAIIFKTLWLLRVRRNIILKKGPFLICPNHASYLDPFAIFLSLPLKLAVNTYFLGAANILEKPYFRWAMKIGRLIPIDPNLNLTDAMQAVSYCLSHKKIVCIFPEGTRSVDENIQEFKKGVGIIIKELGVVSVPTYIKGSHKAWPRTRFFPRLFRPLNVIFGEPVSKENLLSRKLETDVDDYDTIARSLREEVLRLV
ncbi:MAG: AMP-binding protein [Candidatus Omnitrophica bacterium]|nr:AMP-binding protein [Candidatus Omnitrophota bacterium]